MHKTLWTSSSRFLLFLVPSAFYLLPGIIYSNHYTDIQWKWVSLLYLFVLIHQSLENMLQHIHITFNPLIWIAEILNIGIIIYFYISASFFLGNLLVLYSVLIQLQYSFKNYQLDYLAVALLVFFKLILMNTVSFYLSTRFIPLAVVWWIAPFILPFLLSELDRWHKNTPVLKLSVLSLSYLIGLVTIWWITGVWALSILATLPAAYYALRWNNYLSSLTFYSTFSAAACLVLFLFA